MGRSCFLTKRNRRLKMKYFVLLALLGVALAGPSKPEGFEPKPWMQSFRLRFDFLCKKDDPIEGDDWRKLPMPKWIQQIVETRDMEQIKGLCFNVDAHISTMKKFYKNFKDCQPRQLLHLMVAMKHKFYEFCMKGNEEVQKCLGELMGEGGQLQTCASQNGLDKAVDQTVLQCGAALKKTEECVKNSTVCRKEDGTADVLRDFNNRLQARVDRMMGDKDGKQLKRVAMTCKIMSMLKKEKEEMHKMAEEKRDEMQAKYCGEQKDDEGQEDAA